MTVQQFANKHSSVNESKSLILGPTDEDILAQFILQVAFSDASAMNNPVLQGVFALSSLQMDGALKSLRYKQLAIASVRDSIDWLNEKTLLQNLITTMLLYHYEVLFSGLSSLFHDLLMAVAFSRLKRQRQLADIHLHGEENHEYLNDHP